MEYKDTDFFIGVDKESNNILKSMTYLPQQLKKYQQVSSDVFESETHIFYPLKTVEYDLFEYDSINTKPMPSGKFNFDDEKTFVYEQMSFVEVDQEESNSSRERLWNIVREKRDNLLKESDSESKILFLDYWNNQSDEHKTAWTEYRQALRDITVDYDNPLNIVWPTKP